MRADTSIWAWGHNGNGQIGDGTTTQTNLVKVLDNRAHRDAAAGGYHSGFILGL
jgi:alpha-tubulin suppressor-like RCC1 family protein